MTLHEQDNCGAQNLQSISAAVILHPADNRQSNLVWIALQTLVHDQVALAASERGLCGYCHSRKNLNYRVVKQSDFDSESYRKHVISLTRIMTDISSSFSSYTISFISISTQGACKEFLKKQLWLY